MRITLPEFPVEGGCSCGALRYQLTAPPMWVLQCHCGACQTLTGSAYSLAMPVATQHVTITKGQPSVWHRTGGSGAKIEQHICGHCGTRLYSKPPLGLDIITLRAGTLDDPGWARAVAAIWMDDAHPDYRPGGRHFTDDLLLYDTNPDGFEGMAAAWQKAIA